jgi:hypothetical protein
MSPPSDSGRRKLVVHSITPPVRARPGAATSLRVVVVSYASSGNFGDRLGWHLIHQVLPPGATVTHVFHGAWREPTGEFDLVVLGIGNSLFSRLLEDGSLAAFLDRFPRRIGIFGTQFRTAACRRLLTPILQRLDTWYARSQDDIDWAGADARRVVHLGDWQIDAAPMTVPLHPGELRIGREITQNEPLDRAIQQIQSFRRVHSERLHPLLCALPSASAVSYAEQFHPNGQPSGKFRSMLLDVFGRDYPPDQFFEVDRERVRSYKVQVRKAMDVLKQDLAGAAG